MPTSEAELGNVADQDAPYESEARQLAATHLPDLDHPWLGLESFREATRDYFFGRDAEIAEIHLRLRSHPLLVVYGRSGLGKTSILTAGLLPALRSEKKKKTEDRENRPTLLRLRYDDLSFDPVGQLVAAVFGWGDQPAEQGEVRFTPHSTKSAPWTRRLGEKLGVLLPEDYPSRLWLRLHYREEAPDITHLILDQFEEVFTLGAQWPGAESNVRDAMAILLQGAIPQPISQLIAEHERFIDYFDPDSIPVRIVLALRDDYVYALNRWRRHLPALGQNNFELRALRGPAAFDAVFKPGELRCHYRGEVREENKAETGLPPIVDEETARRIVRFIAEKGEEVPIEEIEAVPPILSLLCRELNERRFTKPAGTPEKPAAQITFREGETDIETIITAFYERCLSGRPQAVRIFVEEEFVSPYSGARLPQDERSILKVFTDGCEIPGAADGRLAAGYGESVEARDCLQDLVNRRLLSSLGGSENPSYELIHDLLAAVAEKSRTAREERFEKEQADRRAEADKKAKDEAEERARIDRERATALDVALQKETLARKEADRATRIARWLAITASLVALGAGAAFVVAYNAHTKAEKEEVRAKEALDHEREAKIEAENRKADLKEALGHEREAKTEADKFARQARLALDTAENAKTDAANVRKRSDSLIGLIIIVEKDLTAALERVDKRPLATEFKNRLAEYRRQYADVIPKADSWEDQLKDVRSQGDRLQDKGDLSGALQLYLQGIDLAQKQLDNGRTDDSLARMWLARFMRDQGVVLMTQGNLQQANQQFQKALAIDRQLAQTKPDNLERQRDLSVSYGKVGDVQSAQGDWGAALKSYSESLAINKNLIEQHRGDAGLQRDLAISYGKVGDVQSAQDDWGAALKSYSESLAINKNLIEQHRDNAGLQRDLAISYGKVGDAQSAQGDWGAALNSYRQSLDVNQKLIAQEPGNTTWQEDLAISYGKVGDAQRSAQGDWGAALKSYSESLAIIQKLAAQDPGNASWQRDLVISDKKVKDAQKAQGVLPAEEAMWAVYGQQPKSGGKWSERHFNVEGNPKTAIPKPNETVVAFENVNIRKNTPTWSDQIGDYVHGPIVGYIKPGDRVLALDVIDINPATDDTAWYWIRLSRSPKQ